MDSKETGFSKKVICQIGNLIPARPADLVHLQRRGERSILNVCVNIIS
jgi:hypothetical protein